ncbi:MAG: sigma-70 family RNA polymerase sigma factor [Clostridium sp.]|nr:sigma-70 family RNA polymerase sigma factor [Clostridium sp.]
MENKNDYKEERFDSFLNKTIILSSRTYFKKQMNIINKENTILNNEDFSTFLQGFIDTNCPCSDIYDVESRLELNIALNCLSDIEQAVIFLLFHEELSQNEAAEILEIYSKTVSKIKIRAINKLRNYMKGDSENEK